jgi:predicted aldo/keto reductase-like oxidoreductase
MIRKSSEQHLSRRDFLKRAAGAAAAVTAASAGLGTEAVAAASPKPKPEKPGMKYRILGRTKAKVSALGMGTIRTGSAGDVAQPQIWEAFTKLRKAGKVRFNGVSTHENQVEVIRAAVKTGWYDVVFPTHSALTAERIMPVLAEAKQANVGVMIMKALAPAHKGKEVDAFKGLKGNPFQQSIQWVLKDQNVSTVIVDMPNFDELEEDFAAVANPVSLAELAAFETAVATFAAGTCHMCGACTGQCKYGVRVADVMRHLLYHDGYGDRAYAIARYQELPVNAAACADCASCAVVCPWGVPVRARLEHAHAVLA